jgi:hypothetical protein
MTGLMHRTQPLLHCPQWPAMFALPEPVDALLVAAADAARAHSGWDVYRKHLVGALVMCRAPQTADELSALFRDFASTTRFGSSPPSLPRKNVTIVLPAPVSHRIDLLVNLAGRPGGERVLRRGLVSALVTMRLPDDVAAILALVHDYLACTAADARVPGWPLRRVLEPESPKPGRRALDAD